MSDELIFGAIGSGFVALTSVVTHLYKKTETQNKVIQELIEKYGELKEEMAREIGEMEKRILEKSIESEKQISFYKGESEISNKIISQLGEGLGILKNLDSSLIAVKKNQKK